MKKILLVEDAEDFQLAVGAVLASMDCQVINASSADEAKTLLKENEFHLILLDIGLPVQDGFSLFLEIREWPVVRDLPVIFLTGKVDIEHKVMAFSLGAEDYIQKPFNPAELRARVDAKLKKSSQKTSSPTVIQIDKLVIDLASYKAYILEDGGKRDLALTPIEFKLLAYFAQSPERVFSREQILSAIWGDDVSVFNRTVDTHISGIRKKLKSTQCGIKAVPSAGYKFFVADSSEKSLRKSAS